jgi:hypothetical protein
MTITSVNGTQDWRIDFPIGTWTNPKTLSPCYYVPMVEAINGAAGILSVTENSDGSGTLHIWPNGDQLTSIIIASANC